MGLFNLIYILFIYLRRKFFFILKFIRYKIYLFQDVFNKFVSFKDVMNFEEGEIVFRVQIDNFVFDYVFLELVIFYVFNM